MATGQQGPPSRPWFRLATMARPPTPAPQPDQPPPRPPFIRPAFTPQPRPANVVPPQPLVATLPKESPPSSNPPTPSSVATSPPPPSLTVTMVPTTNRPTSSSPPKTVKTSPSSPNINPLSHPPSPLALPSPQLNSYYVPEYDQKSVLVQETKEKPKGGLNNGDLRRHTAHGATKNPEASKKHLDSEDLGMRRIITIAGENKGAIMDLTPFGNNNKFGKKDNPTASSSDGDKNKNQKSLMTTALINSNVQGVNNSILYNCSTTHHDPGIHLSLSTKPTGGRGFLHKDHIN